MFRVIESLKSVVNIEVCAQEQINTNRKGKVTLIGTITHLTFQISLKAMEYVDFCVIGAGVIGSATAYALAEKGKVALLEQFPLPHSRGSSHGQSRAVRHTYGQEMYAEMMPESFQLWKEIEELAGEKLLIPTGILTIDGEPHNALKVYHRILTKVNCKHRIVDPAELKRNYPMMHYAKGSAGVLEEEGSIIRADKSLRALQKLFVEKGGRIYDGQRVESLVPGQQVTVKSTSKTFKANKVIITAGPWTKDLLLRLQIDLPLMTSTVTVCYWKIHDNRYSYEQKFPMFADVTQTGATLCSVYGFPSYEYSGLMKICNHHGQPASPQSRDLTDSDRDIKVLSEYIGSHLSGVETKPSIVEKCMYTLTPDDDFIIDTHPHYKNIVIGAGFSGHGFKMAPVIGRILSQLAVGEVPKYDVAPFRMSRFKQTSAKL